MLGIYISKIREQQPKKREQNILNTFQLTAYMEEKLEVMISCN